MRADKRRLLIRLSSVLSLLVFSLALLRLEKPFRPNIILITIDALRADHLGCYGYARNTSPNIDKLAKEGVLFTQAIAQSSHTPPSTASILTSTLPHTHLLLHWGDTIRPGLATLPAVLKANGYQTFFICGNGNFSTGLHGFAKSFDLFYDKYYDSAAISNKIYDIISRYSKKPFFVWVHYMDAHQYAPLEPFDKIFIGDKLYDFHKKLPIVKDVFDRYGYKGIPESLAAQKGNVDNPDYYVAQYDGGIRTIDEQLGLLLKKIDKLHLKREPLLIITSDHGEMLGEHAYYFHHCWFLYEPIIKVPLIIKCDKVIPQNKVINMQISAHLDIMPTILDILKINNIKTLEGTSLLPLILHNEKYPFSYVITDEGQGEKCIRTDGWKLIYTNHRYKKGYELYNLKEDPWESNNLVSFEKKEFGFLKSKLDGYKQACMQDRKDKPTLDEETKERLKSLGYTQ
jgi:arylsulfatase A-like enzyme